MIYNKSLRNMKNKHCVKSARIWNFSGPYFPVFGLNTERYGPEKLRIRMNKTLLEKQVYARPKRIDLDIIRSVKLRKQLPSYFNDHEKKLSYISK